MRAPSACHFCRTRRRKCDRDEGQGQQTCSLCRKHNVPCTRTASVHSRPRPYPPTTSSSSAPDPIIHRVTAPFASGRQQSPVCSLPAPVQASPASANLPSSTTSDSNQLSIYEIPIEQYGAGHLGLLPPPAVCNHLVNLYFDYIHDQFHTLFQKPAFMADLASDRVPTVILLAIIALSARFSPHEYFSGSSPRTRGVQYTRRAAQLLDPSDVSLNGIQACVLLGACRIVEGDSAGEAVYYGMACRMAQLLDLAHCPTNSRLDREINVRVWHTLVMIDEWSSSGVGVPRQIANPPEHVPLPMEEMSFLGLRRQDQLYALNQIHHQFQPSSLLGQMIVLNGIFRRVNKMNSQVAQNHSSAPDIAGISDLCNQLDTWETSLPDYMRDNKSNLAHYAAQGLGRIFVAVYLGYYHYGQLLMYQFLHHDASDDPTITTFSRRCKDHAQKLCDMVYAALDTPGCDVLYNMVGHVLVIASTVQIHTLLFSSESSEIDAARSRLERNYTILLRLRDLWPSLDFCMMRLQVFHKACVTSMETSFRLDDWMQKFLSEFAKPVKDKQSAGDAETNGWAIGDIAVTPTSDFGLDSITAILFTAPTL